MIKTFAPNIEEFLALCKPGTHIADIGCFGWRLAAQCAQQQLLYTGVDCASPPGKPTSAKFLPMLGPRILGEDNQFDRTIASHILEHLEDTGRFCHELMRVTRPGGLVWIESPSELSLFMRETRPAEDNSFETFYSDPTHLRPMPPGALYRLALGAHLVPLAISRDAVDFGGGHFPVSRLIAQKPLSIPEAAYRGPRYVTLRGVAKGVAAAWTHVWPEAPPLQFD